MAIRWKNAPRDGRAYQTPLELHVDEVAKARDEFAAAIGLESRPTAPRGYMPRKLGNASVSGG
jgi:hypothetical protein